VDNSALATVANGILTPNSTATGTVKVTATSVADATKSAIASVKVVDWIIVGEPGSNIGIINSDGTGEATLLSLPISNTEACFNPAWFADHLSFVCQSTVGNYFFIYKTDGTGPGTTLTTQVAITTLAVSAFPIPSPSGKSLLFIAVDLATRAQGVYQINVDGSGLQVLDESASCGGACLAISQARYSYDGTKIVYTHLVQGQSNVCTMNADGTDQSCLVPGSDGAFSPDGTKIFFTSTDGVHSIGSAGGQVSALIISGSDAISSPNGLKLVFDSAGSVSTSNIDGSGEETLVAGGYLGGW
jgi:Tol biopolymer transport system component